MARTTKISCVLPLGVKLEHTAAAWGLGDFSHIGPTFRTEKVTSNQPITLVLEVPIGAEAATATALRELLKDLEAP